MEGMKSNFVTFLVDTSDFIAITGFASVHRDDLPEVLATPITLISNYVGVAMAFACLVIAVGLGGVCALQETLAFCVRR